MTAKDIALAVYRGKSGSLVAVSEERFMRPDDWSRLPEEVRSVANNYIKNRKITSAERNQLRDWLKANYPVS